MSTNNNHEANSSAKIHPFNDPDSDPISSYYSLEKFRLYKTRARFCLIGSARNKRLFRVLKIDRSDPSDLNISEDPVVYSMLEINSLLNRISEGNRATGGLAFVGMFYGMAGCIKFLESYYLILVIKCRQIGCICGQDIYGIEETQLITIPHASVQTDLAHSKTAEDLSFGAGKKGDLLMASFKRYLATTSRDGANGWYGGTLLGDFDESSEIYKHYAELCQGPAVDPFQDDRELEKYSEGILQMTRVDLADGPAVEAEMEAALREYNSIGNDLGIIWPS